MRELALVVALGVLGALVVPGGARAGDGSLEWRTIDTRHFRVHFPRRLAPLARRAARICEEAHARLAPLLAHTPAERTQVVLTDFGDLANGSATALPYPRVVLFAAPPALDGNLADYDDWLRVLIYHEYAHILHLDTKSGLPAVLNGVFGKRFAPNQNMPSFMLEGTAVWLESLTSRRGRIRSAVFRGTLRVQALAGRLHPVDAATHAPLEWPGANVWYMYGGHFLDWVARHRGEGTVAAINAAYGDDLIPFALNQAAREATGETVTALWRAWQADLVARARLERAALAAEPGGLTEMRPLTTTGDRHHRPRFLPDGRVAAVEDAGRKPGGIYARRPDAPPDAEAEPLVTINGVHGFDVCPDGRTLVHDQLDRFAGAYAFYDLVVQDLERRRPRRLTRGARIRDPACAPSGTWVAAVQLDHGRARLVRVDLADGAVTVLHDPGGVDQMALPVVAPDGRTVVAVRISETHGRDLVAVDAETGAVRPITADAALELHPRFTPDGRWLLYASDRTGVFDLYARRWPDGPTRRVTRTVGGALEGAVSPDGSLLVASVITPDGFDLGARSFATEALLPAGDAEPVAPPRPPVPDRPLPDRPYDPFETLWPVAWAPAFAFSSAEDSASRVGLSVEASDAAGHHVILGDFATQPAEESLEAAVAYGFRRLTPAFGLSLAHRTRTLEGGARFGDARHDHRERLTRVSGSVSLPFSRIGHGASAAARFSYVRADPAENPDPVFDPLDPAPAIPTSRESTDLTVSLRYGNAEAWNDAISAEEGFQLAATMRLRDRRLGGEADTVELFADYQQFFPLWARHVLALRLNGALGRGDVGRGVFFALGGVPEPRNILLDVLDGVVFGTTFLRGYPSATVEGDRFVLAKLEYRLPLADIYRGPSTVPLFFRRLKLALFTDWGQATRAPDPLRWTPDAFSRSVGVELVSESTLGWRLPVNVRLGWAEGLDEGGETQVYAFLGSWF